MSVERVNDIHQGQVVAQYRKARNWSQQRLAEELHVDLRTVQRMEKASMIQSIDRRRLLIGLLGIPAVLLGLDGDTDYIKKAELIFNDDYMSFFEDELITRWEVYHTGGTARASRSIDRWTKEAANFARSSQGTAWHKRALSVLAMSYQLQGNIARDMMDYSLAQQSYQNALSIASELDDRELIATALLRQGFVFFHQHRPVETIPYLKAALDTINTHGYPHLRRQILGALSEAQAKAGQTSDCWRSLDMAEATSFSDGRGRERTLFLFVPIPILAQKGVNAAFLHDHRRSLALIDKSLASYDQTLVRSRAKLLAQKAEAHYGLGEIDYCVMNAEEALAIARALGSQKRIEQLQKLHETLSQSHWKKEPSVARLGALFHIK